MGDNSSVNGSDDGPPSSPTPRIRWTKQIEKLLTDFADTAACYKWLNDQSYRKYKKINYFYSIPIIILSTLSGAVSVGMGGFVPDHFINLAQLAVGAVNIINGIISTLLNFFRYAQLSESHSNAYVGWSRLHRNIKIELSVERKSRKNPNDFVKVCRSEYDRLMEQQPIIPKDVLTKFRVSFRDKDLVTPDETKDTLRHTVIYEDNDDDYDSDTKDDDARKPSKEKSRRENWKIVKNIENSSNFVKSLKESVEESLDKKNEHLQKVDESQKRALENIRQRSSSFARDASEVVLDMTNLKSAVTQGLKKAIPSSPPVSMYTHPPREDVLNTIREGGSSVKNLLSKFGGQGVTSVLNKAHNFMEENKKKLVNEYVDNTVKSVGNLKDAVTSEFMQAVASRSAAVEEIMEEIEPSRENSGKL